MLRFARLHLSVAEDAEDAVQDVLLAAISSEAPQLFTPDPRPYLFGILKHKIMDKLRVKYRQESNYGDASPEELDRLLFNSRDHWIRDAAPQRWHTPADVLENDHFFQVVDACVERLPAKSARVFSMKELLECEADEICDTLSISKNDYWQCMSRARKQLQICLSQKWFEGGQSYAV